MSNVAKQDAFIKLERRLGYVWLSLLNAAEEADKCGFWGTSQDLDQIREEVQRVQDALLSGRTRNRAVRSGHASLRHVSEDGYLRDGS